MSLSNQPGLNPKLSSDLIFEDIGGCISGLKHVPAGEIWTQDEIIHKKRSLLAEGRDWAIVDNLIIHEEIKRNGKNAQHFLENYKQTIIHLAECGIQVVCYNFMPVFYKLRTHFDYSFSDKHAFSMFDPVAFAVFDLYILRRPLALEAYTQYQKYKARIFNSCLTPAQKNLLTKNILKGVQSHKKTSLQQLTEEIDAYNSITNEELSQNLKSFRREIIPLANSLGIQMHFNLDDPCRNLLGLPAAVL